MKAGFIVCVREALTCAVSIPLLGGRGRQELLEELSVLVWKGHC